MKIGACVLTYFIMSGIVTAMDFFILKETNLVVNDKGGNVFVGLLMKKGDSHVTMVLRQTKRRQEYRVDIGKLFNTDGVLLQTPMLNVFTQNYNAFIKSDKKKD